MLLCPKLGEMNIGDIYPCFVSRVVFLDASRSSSSGLRDILVGFFLGSSTPPRVQPACGSDSSSSSVKLGVSPLPILDRSSLVLGSQRVRGVATSRKLHGPGSWFPVMLPFAPAHLPGSS